MTTFEQLVPPFELCRKISSDAFNDTVFAWKTYYLGVYVTVRNLNPEQPIIAAPTAQEILKEMQLYFPRVSCGWQANLERNVRCYTCTASIGATESCMNGTEFLCAGENLPEVLLKLWLDVRRVKNE